jgi:antitoxin component YwqK of YwqJK toxin-antitoxin module
MIEMKNILLSVVLILPFFLNAQQKFDFVDVEKIMEEAITKIGEEDYAGVVDKLAEIPRRDSIYCSSLISRTYYLMESDQHDKIPEILVEAEEIGCDESILQIKINQSVAFIQTEQYEKALQLVEKELESHPYYYSLLYNKALSLENLGRFKESAKTYIQAIRVKPLDPDTHRQLGVLCYRHGLMAQALMSLNMYMLLNPNIENSLGLLQGLNKMSVQPSSEPLEGQLTEEDDAFKDIDLILKQKVAMQESYDTGTKLDIALVKQNHILFSYLNTYGIESKGIWSKAYAPIYASLMNDEDQYTYFISYLIQAIENEKYISRVQRYVDEGLETGQNMVASYIENLQLLGDDKNYIYDEGELALIGKIEDNKIVGEAVFYNDLGSISAKGQYDENGNRHNKWTYYHSNGNLRETSHFRDDKLVGLTTVFFENGRKSYTVTYKDGEGTGPYEGFTRSGAKVIHKNLEGGENHGQYLGYFEVGEPFVEYKGNYVDGKLNDTLYEYYANGKLYEKSNFKEDMLHGMEYTYFLNNQLSNEQSYKEGVLHGPQIGYYVNGQIMYRATLENGEYEGLYETFYQDGTPHEVYSFKNGEIDGLFKEYNRNGDPWIEYDYRRGDIIAYRFYDRNGQLLADERKKGGKFDYQGYTPYGIKFVAGLYDIDGGKTGKWTYYYKSTGSIESEGVYEDNLAQGEFVFYYDNGTVERKANYKDDQLDGYNVEYYKNGTVKSQGYYKDGELEGQWLFYFLDGTMSHNQYYNKGKLNGVSKVYDVMGKLTREDLFKDGELMKETYYYPNGEVAAVFDYPLEPGEVTQSIKRQDGSTRSIFSFRNGKLHGPVKFMDPNGTVLQEVNYIDGKKDGRYTYYDLDGNVTNYYSYELDRGSGECQAFYPDGTLKAEYYLFNNVSEGDYKYYYENGQVETESFYVNDQLDGERKHYGPDGHLQMVRYYDMDKIIGYSYLDENGNLKPMIPVERETGDIKAYYDNGNMSRHYSVKNDNIQGSYDEYYYNGQLYSTTPYKFGERHGTMIIYYPDGNVKSKTPYFLGEIHGKAEYFYPDGTLKNEQNYKLGTKHGRFSEYDEMGKVVRSGNYYNDILFDYDQI